MSVPINNYWRYIGAMDNDLQRLSFSASQWSKACKSYYPHSAVTEKIIGTAIVVHKTLGPGFMEEAYERSLAHEFARLGIAHERQKVVRVLFRDVIVDTHRVDLIVGSKVVVELKASKAIEDVHVATTLAYLKSTGLQVGLVINFGEARLRVRRVAHGVGTPLDLPLRR